MRLAPSADEVRSRLGDAWPVPGTVDCHAHVFEDGFPLAPARAFDPLPYPLDYYLGWARALGVARCVQVTASCYGFDNSAARFALEECRAAGIAARGVATIHPEIEEIELAKLAKAGFVAARLAASRIGGLGTAAFEALARRCAPHGWHVEINVDDCDEWVALEPRLAASPVPVVFEHLGALRNGAREDAPGLSAVLRLLEKRRDFCIKLCTFYRLSNGPKARFADVAPIVRRFAAEFSDRLMWGSSLLASAGTAEVGDDLGLIAVALDWFPDARVRERVFAGNAARFYGL
jgi:predicted TIM-barrel fold metal-dependent hydrolase